MEEVTDNWKGPGEGGRWLLRGWTLASAAGRGLRKVVVSSGWGLLTLGI